MSWLWHWIWLVVGTGGGWKGSEVDVVDLAGGEDVVVDLETDFEGKSEETRLMLRSAVSVSDGRTDYWHIHLLGW